MLVWVCRSVEATDEWGYGFKGFRVSNQTPVWGGATVWELLNALNAVYGPEITDAIKEGKFPESHIRQYQEGDKGRATAQASRRNRPEKGR